jgi:ketosteroid isomerase-like protein
MTSETVAREIGETFVKSLRMRQPSLLASLLAETVVWSLPGTSRISGEAVGPEAVLERARTIGSVGMQLEVKHLLVGFSGVALSLHNTASHEGKAFDMHLVTVLTIAGDKVVRLDTFMHDIPMVNQFFAV